MNTYEMILAHKLVAIVRGFAPDDVIEMAKAYVAGGLCCMEVTFNQASADKWQETAEAIRAVKAALGEQICIGAGTVMTLEQVQLATQAGAEFMVSPNVDEEVIRETKRMGKISIPGALTPSEVAAAYKMGADIVKLFPANEVGPGYIKALKTPLNHIPLMATGGMRPGNVAQYLAAGSSALGIGGDIVNKQWVANGEFDKIRTAAQAFVDAIQ